METDNKPDEQQIVIDKALRESYNLGIDTAINFCQSQYQVYSMIDPRSPVPMVIDSIIKTLAHFKKV